jgi:hypothetical protein
MNLSELAPHLIVYFGKMIAPVISNVITDALSAYWTSPKKSWVDDSMAACANIAEVECSNCKNKGFWDPCLVAKNTSKPIVKNNATIDF